MKKTAITAMLLVSFSSLAKSPYSAEFFLGKSNYDIGELSESATSYGLRMAYAFNENIALEGSYSLLGESGFMDDLLTLDASSFNLGAKGSLPLNSQLSFFARAGMAFWTLDATIDVDRLESDLGSGIVSASFSGNDFYYGLGAQYNFTESFFGTLEYYSSKVDVDGTDVDLSTIGISVGMKF